MKKSSSSGPNFPPIAVIDWKDHWASTGSWQASDNTARTPLIIRSAGLIIYEDKQVVQLTYMYSEENNHGGFITILKNCIVSRWEVK